MGRVPSATRWQATRRPGGDGVERRVVDPAALDRVRAAARETASARDRARARQIAGEAVPVAGLVGMRGRDRGQERPRVGMGGPAEQVVGAGDLHDAAEIHHRDAVRDVTHDREIVRDEEVGEAELGLQVLEQVDDLRLDRDVERGDRLVADEKARPKGKRPRDADALALTAGEFVRVARGGRARKANEVEQFVDAPGAVLALADRDGSQRVRRWSGRQSCAD